LAASLALTLGCRRDEKIKLEPTDESAPNITSTVHAADPKASVQLLKGFHGIEHNSWRWTMGRFAIALKPPAGAKEKGAVLVLKFTIPDSLLQNSKTETITVRVQNTEVGKQVYKAAGEYTFTADVPAALLKDDTVTAEFVLDPYLAAGTIDARELGVVFVSAALEAK
jgi:hypothetical protein